ncbi:hypothetical protein BDZ89DRAFT_1073024 [Hymenopellis radicata]|nr:hypothetical protein BDZ89DRAFT_1073024 [Hymenopellis radicata]
MAVRKSAGRTRTKSAGNKSRLNSNLTGDTSSQSFSFNFIVPGPTLQNEEPPVKEDTSHSEALDIIHGLQEDIARLSAELRNLKDAKSSCEGMIRSLTDTLGSERLLLEKERTTHAKEQKVILERLENLRVANQVIKESVDDLAREKEIIVKERNLAQTEVAHLRTAAGLTSTQFKAVQLERDSLATRLELADKSIARGKEKLAQARQRVGDLATKTATLEKQAKETVQITSSLRVELAHAKARVSSLENSLEISEARVRSFGLSDDASLFWDEDEAREEAKKTREERAQQAERHNDDIKEAKDRMERLRREEAESDRARKEAEDLKKEQDKKKRREAVESERRETMRKRQEEKERLDKWRKASAEETARCQERDQVRWTSTSVFWGDAKALTRFKALLDEFSSIKFTDSRPLTFASVPWPHLASPRNVNSKLVDWNATERFFAYAKRSLTPKEYKELLSKAQRVFHPDKWSARKLLILDEKLRTALEENVKMVSQVINSLLANLL